MRTDNQHIVGNIISQGKSTRGVTWVEESGRRSCPCFSPRQPLLDPVRPLLTLQVSSRTAYAVVPQAHSTWHIQDHGHSKLSVPGSKTRETTGRPQIEIETP